MNGEHSNRMRTKSAVSTHFEWYASFFSSFPGWESPEPCNFVDLIAIANGLSNSFKYSLYIIIFFCEKSHIKLCFSFIQVLYRIFEWIQNQWCRKWLLSSDIFFLKKKENACSNMWKGENNEILRKSQWYFSQTKLNKTWTSFCFAIYIKKSRKNNDITSCVNMKIILQCTHKS